MSKKSNKVKAPEKETSVIIEDQKEPLSEENIKNFNENWRELLQTDGVWDEDKIMREITDLSFVLEQVGEVYCYITGNKLSKPMYYAKEITTAFDDEVENQVQERLKDEKDSNEAIEKIDNFITEFTPKKGSFMSVRYAINLFKKIKSLL